MPGWHWVQFNPGLPLILSGLFRIFPTGVIATARHATAVATGLMPLLPFLLWRGVLDFRWRLGIGAVLALWPGQIIFSGVVAQENWTMLPVVALACLAVRRLRDTSCGGFPVAAGLLYAAAGATRQDMFAAMLLPAAVAAGLPGTVQGRGTRALRVAAAALLPLLALAAQRHAATGRFAVTTEHGGLGVLGTLAPSSAAAGWVDPVLAIAAVEPALLTNPLALRRASWRLAWNEARRRWRFHALRAAASAFRLSVDSEAGDLVWGLEAPDTQPAATARAAAAFARVARPLLRVEQALISGLFLASMLFAFRRRDAAPLVLGAAALVELLVQVLFSPLGRLMVPVIALEILAIGLAACGAGGGRARLLGLGTAIAAVLLVTAPPLQALVVRKDEAPPHVRRFPMLIAGGGGVYADCAIESGRVWVIGGDRARIGSDPPAPGPGRVRCSVPRLPTRGPLWLDLEAQDPQAISIATDGRPIVVPAGLPGTDSNWRRALLTAEEEPWPREVVLEDGSGAVFGFGLVTRLPGSRPLPRDIVLP